MRDRENDDLPGSGAVGIGVGLLPDECDGDGSVYGMNRTTVYLPEDLKEGVERMARERECSEAEVIREAIREAISRPKPRSGIIAGDSSWSERVDDLLAGFGER